MERQQEFVAISQVIAIMELMAIMAIMAIVAIMAIIAILATIAIIDMVTPVVAPHACRLRAAPPPSHATSRLFQSSQ